MWGVDGAQVDASATNPFPIDVTTVAGSTAVAPTMDNGASGAGVQRVTIASDSTGQIIAKGNVASGATDAGNPIKTGAYATTSLTSKTNVADTTRVDNVARIDGALIVSQWCNLEDIITPTSTTITASTSDTSISAAQAAGIKGYWLGVLISNSSASTFTEVTIKDGLAGTVRATIPVPASSGAYVQFPLPIPMTAATALYAACTVSTTSIKITPFGFKSKI